MLVLALMGAEYFSGGALYDFHRVLGIDAMQTGILAVVLGNGIVFTAVMHYKRLGYKTLIHASPSSMTATALVLFPAILLTIPLWLMAEAWLFELLAAVFPLSGWERNWFAAIGAGDPGMLLLACVLAPVLEEMLFRGIILRSFLLQYGRWPAICGSAALFGAAHLNLYQYAGAVGVGIFLGWLYERSRSLLPCIALHALYNIGCMLLYALVGNPVDRLGDHDTSDGALVWLFALELATAGAWMLRRTLSPAKRAS